MALRTFPQYTISDIYSQFNSNTLNLLLESSTRLEYDEKTFIAKCHGMVLKNDTPRKKMDKKDWKMFLGQIKKVNAEHRLNNNLAHLRKNSGA